MIYLQWVLLLHLPLHPVAVSTLLWLPITDYRHVQPHEQGSNSALSTRHVYKE